MACFFDWAFEQGFDFIATGHYAQTSKGVLKMGEDASKDQSYFLYLLKKDQLKKTLFPIGHLKKDEVRVLARRVGIHTHAKPDSTGICFIGEVNIKEFLKKEINPKRGDVILKSGEIIGEHEGAWFYTIGQRHGFTVNKYQGKPLFVIEKDVEKNILVVGDREDVKRADFQVGDFHWHIDPPKASLECDIRIRHLGELHRGVLAGTKVHLDSKVFGVSPGQSAVFYKDGIVLGGAIIQ